MCDSRDSGYDLNDQYWKQLLKRNLVSVHCSGLREKVDCWFVTYPWSQVQDKNEFHRYFRNSIDPHIPRSRDKKKQAKVQIFGCKEVRADGVYYHVAVCFSKRAGWRKARPVFTVYIDDEKEVADASSPIIYRRKPNRKEHLWMVDIQELLLAKSGDIFGDWV